MSAKCQIKVSQVQQIELNEKRNEKDDYTEAYNLVKEAIMNSSRNEKENYLFHGEKTVNTSLKNL